LGDRDEDGVQLVASDDLRPRVGEAQLDADREGDGAQPERQPSGHSLEPVRHRAKIRSLGRPSKPDVAEGPGPTCLVQPPVRLHAIVDDPVNRVVSTRRRCGFERWIPLSRSVAAPDTQRIMLVVGMVAIAGPGNPFEQRAIVTT
jgi:hypothetical protein